MEIFMNEEINYFICPFCNSTFKLNYSTKTHRSINFDTLEGRPHINKNSEIVPEEIDIVLFKCPGCEKVIVKTEGIGGQYKGVVTDIYPKSLARQFPDYIPNQIRQDYEESYSIVNLSPKASATLARRTLQGMIRDFHGVKKPRLIDEINAIRDKVTPSEKTVLDSIRDIGNIGAHPEKDINLIVGIEPGEAEKLLKVIEYFMKSWYITRHEAQQLFIEVNNINEKFQKKRKSGK